MDFRIPGTGNFIMAFALELESLNLQIMLGTGNLSIGVCHFGIGDLLLLEGFQSVIEGTRQILTREDKLIGLINKDDFSIAGNAFERRGKGDDGIDFFLHGDKEIRMHVGIEPCQVFQVHVAMALKGFSNVIVKGGIMHLPRILKRFVITTHVFAL